MADQIEDDYTSGKWPICDEIPLSSENFADYKAKYGDERADGYLDAIVDFQKHFMRCFKGFTDNQDGITFHQKKVGADVMIKKLFHRNNEVLKKYKNDPNQRSYDQMKTQ